MAKPEDFLVDPWSPLDHKRLMQQTTESAKALPSWVDKEHWRRLTAYIILAMYLSNTARRTLGTSNPEIQDKRRELGDPDVIRSRIREGVLGDSWQISVTGASTDHPAAPPVPDEPGDPAEDGLSSIEAASREAQRKVWEANAQRIIDEWLEDVVAQPALRERQEWLNDWAKRQMLGQLLIEREDDAIGLGDAVFVLRPQVGEAPDLELIEPASFFATWDEEDRGTFPDMVMLAWGWEEPDPETGKTLTKVRRQIFELVDLGGVADGAVVVAVDEDGPVYARSYPWLDPDTPRDRWPTRTCVLSDWVWDITTSRPQGTISEWSTEGAEVEELDDGTPADEADLGIPFIPVVHYPDTPSSRFGFGTSLIALLAQLFDDLAANDSDISEAGQFVGGPVISLGDDQPLQPDSESPTSGEPAQTITPGMIIRHSADGSMGVLDLSGGIEQLMRREEQLLDRVAVNSKVSNEVLGRVDSTAAASGIQIALSFGPFDRTVMLRRSVREPKDRMLLEMVQRLAQLGGVLDDGLNPPAMIDYGSFLPSDVAGVVRTVVELRAADPPIISAEAALRMLSEAGVPITDVVTELDAITARDYASAALLADATGSEQAAADLLGIEVAPTPAADEIDLPLGDLTGGG